MAQGYANIASALVGGLCCSGALTRTATNVRAGAWGPVAGIFSSSFLLGVMSIAAPLASHIPLATLVITIVAWDMVDRKAIVSIFKRDRNESLVLSATFLLTVFRDVTEGIGVDVASRAEIEQLGYAFLVPLFGGRSWHCIPPSVDRLAVLEQSVGGVSRIFGMRGVGA